MHNNIIKYKIIHSYNNIYKYIFYIFKINTYNFIIFFIFVDCNNPRWKCLLLCHLLQVEMPTASHVGVFGNKRV